MYYSMLKITPAYYSVSVEMLKQSWRCRNIAVGVEALFTIETLKHIENNHLLKLLPCLICVKFLFGQGICGRGR